ncbi:MAG TPA: DinB family protein [Thermoanaerobaculia bacterium]|nr:DinB family protein [Thermoanaerobaculia bacterium]
MSRSPQEIARLYEFNRWANGRTLEACDAVSAGELEHKVGGSFSTILGTLAHLIGAEWVWLERWQGRSPRALPEGFANLGDLKSKLAEIEDGQRGVFGTLTPARMAEPISYVNFKGETWSYPLGDALVHVVNHGTYHRGQVATLLRQLGKTPLATDYLLFLDGKAKEDTAGAGTP